MELYGTCDVKTALRYVTIFNPFSMERIHDDWHASVNITYNALLFCKNLTKICVVPVGRYNHSIWWLRPKLTEYAFTQDAMWLNDCI